MVKLNEDFYKRMEAFLPIGHHQSQVQDGFSKQSGHSLDWIKILNVLSLTPSYFEC